MKTKDLKQSNASRSQKWFHRPRRRHDPMLVFNMSVFNYRKGSGMHLQFASAARERLVLAEEHHTLFCSAAEVRRYAKLQRLIHDALRAQHPEWVRPNGDSPICDAYESRFEELLRLSLQFERWSALMPARYVEARNIVFHRHPSATHRFFIKRKEHMNKIIEPNTPRIGSARGIEPGRAASPVAQRQSGVANACGICRRASCVWSSRASLAIRKMSLQSITM